jgi:hypothetical protein
LTKIQINIDHIRDVISPNRAFHFTFRIRDAKRHIPDFPAQHRSAAQTSFVELTNGGDTEHSPARYGGCFKKPIDVC